MGPRSLARTLCTIAFYCAAVWGQTVTSTIIGTVTDPANAVLANEPVTLKDAGTGSVRSATTDSAGIFRFANVNPGNYSISVSATGFKTHTTTGVEVSANETRNVGSLQLQLGSLSDTVSITAEATPIQLSSSEKSQEIDGNQLNAITLKGRDLFGYMKLVPGVIDRSSSRDVTSPGAIGNITINGNTSALNFTVDGVTDMDTGSNGTLHYEPNLDAVQELKVLTSNYQAEFGRNSGGTITVVTKSGTRDFHGSGAWNHRHEQFNANNWQNNRSPTAAGLAQPIPRYRFNVETYTIGGPIYIPKVFNREKKRFFFFWSQEYTGQFVSGGTQTKYTPTALERQGDFSQSFANNGTLLTINDPQSGAPFPGNRIPANRADPTGLGPAMLAFFPLPNFTGTGNQANVVNYFEAASATHPRRNDVLRIDTIVTSKINGYFRWINDHDDMLALYQGVQFSSGKGGKLGDAGIAPVDHPNPGHGYSGSATYMINPTLINEFTVGESWNTWAYYSTDNYKTVDRSLLPSPAVLFPIPTKNPPGVSAANGYLNLLPQFQFGGTPANAMNYTKNHTSAGSEENFNTIWSFTDNVTKIVGSHAMKAGVYFEYNKKLQPNGAPYAGSYNFQPDVNNLQYNTSNGYANAFLGYVQNYQQATARATFDVRYWNAEFYAQDNWKVNRRLTLDFGVRFYHQPPQNDINHTFANFFPGQYSASSAPRLYVPAKNSNGTRVAQDPGTGQLAPVAYIGLYVPNSGNPADGFQLLGQNNVSLDTYHLSYLKPAPRIGFAYDVFGNGKTALRGGFGMFFNRLDGNQVYNLAGQPPYAYTPQVNYTTVSQISQSGGSLVFGPQTYYAWPTSTIPWNSVQNTSINIQHSLAGFVMDIGYVGNWGHNQNLNYSINSIPLGGRFQPSATDTTNNGKLPDVLLRTKYKGFNTINQYAEIGHTNYNSLQATMQRRLTRGLAFGAAYTYSKALGTTSFNPVVPDNEVWNYGRLAFDRRHNLQINWNYAIPSASRYLGKFSGVVLDHWTYSGVMSSQSGGPYNPGFGFASGSTPDYTGTPDVGARILVVGDPYANVPAGALFNPAAFTLPVLGTTSPATPVLGNLGGGSGVLSLPYTTNFDMTLVKFIPLGLGERRGLKFQVQAYNVFNHTEINGLNTGIQFNPTTGAVVNGAQAGTPNSALPNRVLAFGLRFDF